MPASITASPSALKGILQPPVIYARWVPGTLASPQGCYKAFWSSSATRSPAQRALFRLPLISKRSTREVEESEEGKARSRGGKDAKNRTLPLVGTVNGTRGSKGQLIYNSFQHWTY